MVKYVVTDPCYILSDAQWDECCKYLGDDLAEFAKAVSRALTEHTGYPAYAHDTGCGDWSNRIYGPNIIRSDFCADSGMVSVCRLTPEVEADLKDNPSQPFEGAAIFEASEDIEVRFSWTSEPSTALTLVEITDNQTGLVTRTMDWKQYEEENSDDE